MTKGKPEIEWNADTIKALRQHMGLTQEEMSKELGTRQQTISEWETGMYKPRGATRTLLNIIAERAGFMYHVEEEKEDKSYSEEYASYLERYELFGEDRPKLSPEEFERLDDELLDLLVLDADGQELTEDQEERYLELMFLLVAE